MKKAKTRRSKRVLTKGTEPKSIAISARLTPTSIKQLKAICSRYTVENEFGDIVPAPKTVVLEHLIGQAHKNLGA